MNRCCVESSISQTYGGRPEVKDHHHPRSEKENFFDNIYSRFKFIFYFFYFIYFRFFLFSIIFHPSIFCLSFFIGVYTYHDIKHSGECWRPTYNLSPSDFKVKESDDTASASSDTHGTPSGWYMQ